LPCARESRAQLRRDARRAAPARRCVNRGDPGRTPVARSRRASDEEKALATQRTSHARSIRREAGPQSRAAGCPRTGRLTREARRGRVGVADRAPCSLDDVSPLRRTQSTAGARGRDDQRRAPACRTHDLRALRDAAIGLVSNRENPPELGRVARPQLSRATPKPVRDTRH
jgi:hypothetical protein